MEYHENYKDYLYSGLSGKVMNFSHKMMERPKSINNERILEIGAGAVPHFTWIKDTNSIKEYLISDTKKTIDHLRKTHIEIPKYLKFHSYDQDKDYSQIEGRKFTRIIASHVLEHIPEPEKLVLKWVTMLETEGCLSVALPCDPGLLWKLGQKIKRRKSKKLYGLDAREYDLLMSKEHINSAQNLIKIINYYFNKPKWSFFPFFFIPLVEINLIVTVNLNLKSFRG